MEEQIEEQNIGAEQDGSRAEHRDKRQRPEEEGDNVNVGVDVDADVMLALALQEEELQGQDLTHEELMLQLYQQDVWNEQTASPGDLKPSAASQDEHPQHDEESPTPTSTTTSAVNEFEDETRLMQSPVGVAWKLVERLILLWHSRPAWNGTIALLSRDDMVAMAERLVILQREWKLLSSSAVEPRWSIDVGFHWTRQENLDSIREGGLLTKMERDEAGIRARYHGSVHGDGVYTASNPFSFFGSYGPSCLMVARMQGTVGPRDKRDQVDTVVDLSGRMAVLKSSAQCLPIFTFSHDDIHPNAGAERLFQCHVDVQRILDEFLNDNLETPVRFPYGFNDPHSRPRNWFFQSPAPPPKIVIRPLPTRRAAADSNWGRGPLGLPTNRPLIKNAGETTEHTYVAPSLIGASSISYSPTAKMVYFRNGMLTCQGFEQGTIIIKYIIQQDTQRAFHPNPGELHSARQRVAFLPDNSKGNALLKRLEAAFLRGQTFCIGPRTGQCLPNEVDWVIPHKHLLATGFDGYKWTETVGRAEGGFPDAHYFQTANSVLDAFELVTDPNSGRDGGTGLTPAAMDQQDDAACSGDIEAGLTSAIGK